VGILEARLVVELARPFHFRLAVLREESDVAKDCDAAREPKVPRRASLPAAFQAIFPRTGFEVVLEDDMEEADRNASDRDELSNLAPLTGRCTFHPSDCREDPKSSA